MILDAYNTVWKAGGTSDYLTSEDFTAEMMLPAMDAAQVDMAVICSLGQLTDNDYIEECCLNYADRFIGFCQVDPRPQDAVTKLKALADREVFRGVKLHPTMHGYHFADHGLLDPIFQTCSTAGLLVLVNALDDPFCAPLSIEEIARGFPEMPVIIAHMGSVWNVTEAILVAKRSPNIYLETSSAELQAVQDAYRQVGPERVVMGTDWPGSDFDLERAKIAKAVSDAKDRELVEGANLARLLRVPLR
jgi:predicted TIM-barrel fold metal-dependent hydrolase